MTNHARVLAIIARDPDVRLRDVAATCQLTERAVQAIVADLEQAGYLAHTRSGRRNRYRIAAGTMLRHPAEHGLSVAALLDMLDSREAGTVADGGASQADAGERHPSPTTSNSADAAEPLIGEQAARRQTDRRTDHEPPTDE